MSSSPYQPAPPPPPGAPAPLVNGRPMTRTSWWPDRRPLPTPREQVWALVGAVALVLSPFVVDLAGGPPWRTLWIMSALGVALLAQAGMDTARPPAHDRFAVRLYRTVYFALPFVVTYLVLAFGTPGIFEVY
jgi:hypothetical protein